MRLVLSALFLVACANDYGLNAGEYEGGGEDTDTSDGGGTDGGTWGDSGGTPWSDDCELDQPLAGAVDVVEACEAYEQEEVADAWDLGVEWEYPSGSTVVTPVVGNLVDTNGDGTIDADDMPQIAFTQYSGGTLVVVNGDGTPHCTASGFRSDGGVVIADIDGDGDNDIAGPTSGSQVKAVDGDCNPLWTSSDTFSLQYPVSTAADLDGDGRPEVIADTAVVDGATGNTVATLSPTSSCWRTPIAADLDLDGSQEIILGTDVFNRNGTRLWSASASGTSCFGAVVNTDSDPEAEVVMSVGTSLQLYEHDGTLIQSVSQSVSNPGPPCAGDIDGDGQVEIIAPGGNTIRALEHDFTLKWSATMQDNSGAAGCSVFDMNGDGTYEVLFADETALRIYDGTTGTVLYQNTTHGSVTYFEYPSIADVDNDGSAEMIVANSSGAYGAITVFGHNGSGWPPAGPTWGVHDFAMSNQDSDGGLPASPAPSWLEYNIFRGRPFSDGEGRANLEVGVIDVCVEGCETDSTIWITWQAWNSGGVATDTATKVSLYMLNGGVETFYDSTPIEIVDSGRSLDGGYFGVPLADMGSDGFMLVVDDDNGAERITECLETDNTDVYLESFCG